MDTHIPRRRSSGTFDDQSFIAIKGSTSGKNSKEDKNVGLFSRKMVPIVYAEVLEHGRQNTMNAVAFDKYLFSQGRPKKMAEAIFAEINNRIRQVKSWHAYCTPQEEFKWRKEGLDLVINDMEKAALFRALGEVLEKYYKWITSIFVCVQAISAIKENEVWQHDVIKFSDNLHRCYSFLSTRVEKIRCEVLDNVERKERLCVLCEKIDEFIGIVSLFDSLIPDDLEKRSGDKKYLKTSKIVAKIIEIDKKLKS